jgi:hypothetical protein
MDNMTQQNASLVEETASASEEMANQARELLGMTEEFKISDSNQGGGSRTRHREIHLKAAEAGGMKTRSLRGDKPAAAAPTGTGQKKDLKDIMNEEGFDEF